VAVMAEEGGGGSMVSAVLPISTLSSPLQPVLLPMIWVWSVSTGGNFRLPPKGQPPRGQPQREQQARAQDPAPARGQGGIHNPPGVVLLKVRTLLTRLVE
jgi:hypothetical protein